jgi:hypothetical protein
MPAVTPLLSYREQKKLPHVSQFIKLLEGACGRTKAEKHKSVPIELVTSNGILNI